MTPIKLSRRLLKSWMVAYEKYVANLGYVSRMAVVAGSGNQTHAKGDVRIDIVDPDDDSIISAILAEHKATAKGQMTVKHRWLRKIEFEGLKEGRDHLLGLTFTNPETGELKHYLVTPL